MPDSTRPVVAPGCHPIETGRYRVPTRAINDLGEVLLDWIHKRSPGGIITGRPRLGKTRTVEYLTMQLPRVLGDAAIPMYKICCNKYRVPTENTFYGDILMDLGHAEIKGTIAVRRDRICKYLIAAACASNQRRVILILDDAHRLTRLLYECLTDIHNQLDRHEVNLTVFLVGQPELIHQKQSLLAMKAHQIVGRFMVHEYQFHGIRSVEDVRECLQAYDTGSEYPHGSGWSCTRYYFPTQFDRGFRLEQYAEDLWRTFQQLHSEDGLGPSVEIPMQYFALTVEYLLTEFGIDGKDVDRRTKSNLREAVTKSGYVIAEKYARDNSFDDLVESGGR
ncbi:MAG: ATP-binding protein [Firmicutes bacterium]|nr:ATP-binding protein [Bacillota bacterium]